MNADIPEMPKFPKIEILPIIDRVISAGLWVGRLLTRQVAHDPTEHQPGQIGSVPLEYPDHSPQHSQYFCSGTEPE